jgi:acyl-CoA hydrolase/RimJ/RimL family protein N-acetyltransferase
MSMPQLPIEKPSDPAADPDWKTKYADRIEAAAGAVSRIRAGQRVFVGTGAAQPQALVRALADRAGDLQDTEIVHLLTMGEAPYALKELSTNFVVNSFFIADNVRPLIQEGLGSYTPIFLSDIPRLFSSGRLPLDVALIQVSPPDRRGLCSLGVSVDIVRSAAENASLVIAQVNTRMPRTLGDSFVHAIDLDILVPSDEELPELPPAPQTDVTRRIGEHVASLVEDGSTLQLGFGRVPHAVIPHLKMKKDLGLHTEMLTDDVIDLVESGAVTGARKKVDRGLIVTSFCMGTRRLYDYVDDNPLFSFRPTEYVNDPHLISQHPRMVAVNAALEVDLTGQVCADSLGAKFFSGIGGHVDFNRGAARSPGGKAIIAIPSTAKGGTVSRIVAQLSPGAGVVTTRGDVHYVVTEHGAAYLHGKTIQERALALISIAHPDFRADLLRKAIEAKYVRQELADVEGKVLVGPAGTQTTFVLDDGTPVLVRPIHPTDEPRMKDLFYALSQQTLYYRFMRYRKFLPRKEIQNFTYVDHRNEVALVGTLPEAHGEDIIAMGCYYLDPRANRAEVAFIVRDAWQNRGIGTFLHRQLITLARRNGIAGFTADVLRENKAMQEVFQKSGCQVRSRLVDGVYHFDIDFS